jgi:hypothetical protein
MFDSKSFGITIYSLMAFFHFLMSIEQFITGYTIIAIVQLLGSAFWFAMIHIDPQLKGE